MNSWVVVSACPCVSSESMDGSSQEFDDDLGFDLGQSSDDAAMSYDDDQYVTAHLIYHSSPRNSLASSCVLIHQSDAIR